MTKKDLFITIIRAIALYYLVKSTIDFVPAIGLYIESWNQPYFLGLIISSIMYLALALFFLLRADFVVNILGMNRGFDDERIELNKIDANGLVKIILLFLGVYLIISSAPRFFSLLFYWFRDSIPQRHLDILIGRTLEPTFLDVNRVDILELFLKMFLGFILMRNTRRFADLILGHYQKENMNDVIDHE